MCGIAGFVERQREAAPDSRAGHAEVLDRMCRAISHRGPDDQGVMVHAGVGLGMRRLSIIDLAGGHQPISGCDPSISVVFNGEIYNYRELHQELERRGHRFHTHSDTESIVHLYEEHGAGCVEHLRGMFAFAIWDDRKRELFIARDRAGKKPLYYTLTPRGTLVFGSELKSLLEHPEVERGLDTEALDAYLTFGYVPDPLSIFRGVRKLPPGHHLTYKDGRVSVKQYWDFPFEMDAQARSEEDYLEELSALLDESVRLRLVADVPLGAFLSGGVDSSAVVGLMSRHTPQPVKTFSIGFHEDSYSELKYARVAAKHFGTDHHEFIVTPDICNIVDELAWHFDEPFADSSAIPTYMVSKLAREHVKVVLSGDGGDELFAGYTRYQIDRQRSGFSHLPSLVRRGVMRPLSRRLPHGAWGRNFIYNVALDPVDRYIDSVSVFSELNKPSLYTDDFMRELAGLEGAFASYRRVAASVGTNEPLDRMLYLDSKTYLPGDILTKVDRMSMAVSLEARVPLLDHRLIEMVARMPAHMKMRGTETKHIFKRAVRSLVPSEILDRPKQGFGVPLQEWINDQLRGRIHETLREQRTRERGLINERYVRLLLEEHERGRRDHSAQLWALFMLEQWHRVFMDGAPGRLSQDTGRGEPLSLASVPA
ncbi:MAG TPA: asparagine synthase (glutamine-hydrolyzing) [Pyrinomonadaceae bacterium]|nr:asparagine synthase (glutamine-hydrolyzing) [Pyrinomonadaceae bacterium]